MLLSILIKKEKVNYLRTILESKNLKKKKKQGGAVSGILVYNL